MTIKRTVNGVEMEFELTDMELFEVYKEYEHGCDRSDIISAFEGVGDDNLLMEVYGHTMEELMPMVEEMANRYRKCRDNSEDWVDDRDYAIRRVLYEREEDEYEGNQTV